MGDHDQQKVGQAHLLPWAVGNKGSQCYRVWDLGREQGVRTEGWAWSLGKLELKLGEL